MLPYELGVDNIEAHLGIDDSADPIDREPPSTDAEADGEALFPPSGALSYKEEIAGWMQTQDDHEMAAEGAVIDTWEDNPLGFELVYGSVLCGDAESRMSTPLPNLPAKAGRPDPRLPPDVPLVEVGWVESIPMESTVHCVATAVDASGWPLSSADIPLFDDEAKSLAQRFSIKRQMFDVDPSCSMASILKFITECSHQGLLVRLALQGHSDRRIIIHMPVRAV